MSTDDGGHGADGGGHGTGNCGHDSCGCSDDESFHPLGEEWEDEMRERLEDTEYDAELGMEMARDAQRLIQGEISESEFKAEYEDAVVEEFGVDDRPIEEMVEEGEIDDEIVAHFDDPGGDGEDPDRREMMKKMGLGAGAVGLGSGLIDGGDDDEAEQITGGQLGTDKDSDNPRWGMVIDLERCDGCLQCVQGCREENSWDSGANWMYVLTYEDEKTEQENFLVRPCQHCNNAPCEKVCPVEARHTREQDNLVLTDYQTCIGCRYCQVACPYGVNYFGWHEPETPAEELDPNHVWDERGRAVDGRQPKGVMGKCTFCPTRQDGNFGEEKVGTVACMEACDQAGMSAIHFGDLNDPESRPNRYLERRAEQEFDQDTQFEDPEGQHEETVTPWGKLSAFKLLEEMNTDPNVTYLGNEPGPEAHQVEGPVSYEDIGQVDNRKDVLDFGAGAREQAGDLP